VVLRRGVAVALAAALLLGVCGCGDLSRDELNRGVESLSALAPQGELLANGVGRDATKSTYTRVMAKTLGGEAEHEAEKLSDAEPSPEVAEEREAAVQIAGELAGSVRSARNLLASLRPTPLRVDNDEDQVR
jgi:hypothetical protein